MSLCVLVAAAAAAFLKTHTPTCQTNCYFITTKFDTGEYFTSLMIAKIIINLNGCLRSHGDYLLCNNRIFDPTEI